MVIMSDPLIQPAATKVNIQVRRSAMRFGRTEVVTAGCARHGRMRSVMWGLSMAAHNCTHALLSHRHTHILRGTHPLSLLTSGFVGQHWQCRRLDDTSRSSVSSRFRLDAPIRRSSSPNRKPLACAPSEEAIGDRRAVAAPVAHRLTATVASALAGVSGPSTGQRTEIHHPLFRTRRFLSASAVNSHGVWRW